MEGAHFSRRRGTHAKGTIRARLLGHTKKSGARVERPEKSPVNRAREAPTLQKKRLSNRRAPRGSARSSLPRLEARVGVRASRARSHSFKSRIQAFMSPRLSLFPPFLRRCRASERSERSPTVPDCSDKNIRGHVPHSQSREEDGRRGKPTRWCPGAVMRQPSSTGSPR